MRAVIDNNLDDLGTFLGLYANVIDAQNPAYRRWSITNVSVGISQVGSAGLGSVFSYAHQWEGFSLGAWTSEKADGTSERPGFIKACNDWIPGIARFWDPGSGGCTYYLGMDILWPSSGNDFLATEFTSIAAAMTSDRMNTGNGNLSAGQIVGSGFVCPGAGQSAPTTNRINTNGVGMTTAPSGLDASWYPGISFHNPAGLAAPFKGNAAADAHSFVMQQMAPIAIWARCSGANPMALRIWDAGRARQNASPNVGITLVRAGVEAPSNRVTDGFFMYAYTPH
jgi:hypothetical protein